MPRKSQPHTLSPIQHLILVTAAEHPDHRLARPEVVKPPTYRSALQALRRRGLIANGPVADGSDRRSAAPILSPAGVAHIAPIAPEAQAPPQPESPPVRAPRPSTKLAILVTMLAPPDGASIDKLIATLDWLPHTTRAALTGLRKRGYALATIRSAGAPTRYRIAADGLQATDTAAPATVKPETATEAAAR